MAELLGDAALPQINGSIKRFRQTPQIVRCSQHAGATASLFTQHFVDDISSRLIDGIQRLIQQKQTGSLNDRSSQQRALLLAAGKLTHLTLGQIEAAVLRYSADEAELAAGDAITSIVELLQLPLEDAPKKFRVTIPSAGGWVLFTEHHPDEFEASLQDAAGNVIAPLATREYKPDHEHDEEVTSVGITSSKELDLKKFQKWLGRLLAEQGPDIFRMKGILNFKDMDTRYVFQGVHMLFDGREDRPWGDQARRSSLIFIGRNLDRESLNAEFEACLA